MQWLASVSVRRPVFATVLILVIVVVGLVGYRGLGVDKYPDVDFPAVTVVTLYPGAAPPSVETDVTEKIESAVNTVSGIETMSSVTTEGASMVVVQFELEKNGDVAAQEIRDRIDSIVGDLPVGVEQPKVQKLDPDAAPILMLSVEGDLPVEELTRIADDEVRPRLETVSGVGQLRVIGGQERRIEIHLDPIRMAAHRVSGLEVQRAVAVSNVSVPGGRLEQGPVQATLRIEGRVGSPEQIGELIVRRDGETAIRVRDVARVEDGVATPTSAGVRDGDSSVVLAVRKQSGANTVEVVDRVRAAVAEIGALLPAGARLDVVRDNSEVIRTSAHQVLEHLVIGSLLAALVVLVFLGSVRSTLIAAVSIPVSIVGTFGLMYAAGFTLNMMTLLALALAVGIVIDDAIVVLENIHRHVHEKGMKPFPAAVLATKEIGLAVLSTTLSLMAVFLPVAFMGGIVGRFLASFGLTMAFAVGVSMIVSFTIVPMMAARMLPPPAPLAPGEHPKRRILERVVDFLYLPIQRAYMAMLRFALRRRWVVVLAVVGSLAMVPVLAKQAGFGFLPENDEAQFEIYVEAPEGTSLDATALLAERLSRKTRAISGVTHTLVTVGDDEQQRSNVARVYVRLTDPDQRSRSQAEVMDDVRHRVLSDLPDGTFAAAQLVADMSFGGQNAQVMYVISGPELDRLERYGRDAVAALALVPGVVDADSSVASPSRETVLRPDRERAAALGVDPADINATLRLLVGGAEVSTYQEGDEQYDVFVRAEERYRVEPAGLAVTSVPSRTLGLVPLSEVVTVDEGESPSQINRLARERQVMITCNIAPGHDQGSIVAALEKIVDDLDLPPGYSAATFGQAKEMERTKAAFGFAFLLSFVFMYLVLAAQFESWLHPLTILLALPLTLPFALLSSVLFGMPLNIFSMLGLLVLFGVVKKNSILQIDLTNQLRAAGMPRDQAILEANRSRLKPILMTTLAFVAGMLPLVFSTGIGAGFSKAMATIVVGGQSLSLLLTLLAIPVIYSLFDDAGAKLGGLVARLRRHRTPVDRGEAELLAAR